MTTQAPFGTVTFMLTDLEGSTRIWEQNPTAMKSAMVRHDELLEKAIAENDGFVFSRMGDGMAAAFSTMVAGRLRDWDLTVTLTARAMDVWLWDMSPLWAAICFAECARAVAEDNLEVAGILRGAAYAAFRQASPVDDSARPPDSSPVDASANFVLTALRETGDLVAAALGDDRRRQLRD